MRDVEVYVPFGYGLRNLLLTLIAFILVGGWQVSHAQVVRPRCEAVFLSASAKQKERAHALESLRHFRDDPVVDLQREIIQNLYLNTDGRFFFDPELGDVGDGFMARVNRFAQKYRTENPNLRAIKKDLGLSEKKAQALVSTVQRILSQPSGSLQAFEFLMLMPLRSPEGEVSISHAWEQVNKGSLETRQASEQYEKSLQKLNEFKMTRRKDPFLSAMAFVWSPMIGVYFSRDMIGLGTGLAVGTGILALSFIPGEAESQLRQTVKYHNRSHEAAAAELEKADKKLGDGLRAMAKSFPERALDRSFEENWESWKQEILNSHSPEANASEPAEKLLADRLMVTSVLMSRIAEWQLPDGESFDQFLNRKDDNPSVTHTLMQLGIERKRVQLAYVRSEIARIIEDSESFASSVAEIEADHKLMANAHADPDPAKIRELTEFVHRSQGRQLHIAVHEAARQLEASLDVHSSYLEFLEETNAAGPEALVNFVRSEASLRAKIKAKLKIAFSRK